MLWLVSEASHTVMRGGPGQNLRSRPGQVWGNKKVRFPCTIPVLTVRGAAGTKNNTSRCRETVWAAGPFTAGGGTARPCRLDGDMAALRLLVAVKDRRKTRKALEREWSHRQERLVNQRRSASRTGEVDEKSRGLGLPATTHLACTSGEHLSELEPALSPLLTLSC